MEVSWQLHVSALHSGHHQVDKVRVEQNVQMYNSALPSLCQPDDGHYEGLKHVVAS
jgi:hypothetical protein